MASSPRQPPKLAVDAEAWRFEPIAWVSRGATSEVWKAHDRRTDRTVALKIARGVDHDAVLAAEAEKLAATWDPRLPELLDVGRVPKRHGEIAEGAAYLAMTWMAGQPLPTAVRQAGVDRLHLAALVARDIGSALAHLDAVGVAHGDVKPANLQLVFATDAGEKRAREARRETSRQAVGACLLDLGLSTDADVDAPTGGTPRYLPPELWSSARTGDGRARDRFALGLVLAEIIDPSLEQATDLATAARAARLPPPFDGWCRALLAPDPGARPRPSWIADQARFLLDARSSADRADTITGGSPDASDAPYLRGAIRAAYLGARGTEVQRLSRAARAIIDVAGEPGAWLERTIDLKRRAAALRGETPTTGEARMQEAGALDRARWLTSLVGSPAARWPVGSLSLATDDDWRSALDALALRKAPGAWTFADLETQARASVHGAGAAHVATAPSTALASLGSEVEIALALATENRRAAIEVVEHGTITSPLLRRATADTLRRLGEAGRALALLSLSDDDADHALRADVARRAGDVDLARKEAEKALKLDGQNDRAKAVLARLAIDTGQARQALARLDATSTSVTTAEARALALIACGERGAAERELVLAETLAATEEARGRVAGLVAYVAHASGDIARAASAYAKAMAHAERAETIVEEASYAMGLAGASVDLGDIAQALDAASRASLLWDHLRRPAEAAVALLARAAAFSTAGAVLEAISAAREARERARWLGDRRAEAFACWAVTDVLPDGHDDAREPARAAIACLGESAAEEDRLRALARLLRHFPTEMSADRLAWGDDVAARETTVNAARLEWWGARAVAWLGGHGAGRAETAVTEICRLAAREGAVAARGPAFAAAGALAARLGDGNAVRLLSRAQAETARTLLSRVPPDLRAATLSVPWVQGAHATEKPSVSAEQIADFGALVRALGTRDRLRPLLEQVLDSLILWTGVERGLLLLSAPNGKLVPRAARNLARADLEGEQLLLSNSLALKAIQLGEPVVAVDAAGELPSLSASVHALKLRSVLAIPLSARGQSLGVVYLDDRIRRGAFGPEELAWVKLVASLAAVAIADARDQILLRRAARKAERTGQALARELSRREVELDVMGRELLRTQGTTDTRFRYDAIVGRSPKVEEMLHLVDRVTVSSIPVLVMGESGSGKELIARAIHGNGPRARKMFVGENCAAIPEPLLESTLFGHARGAFTGADRARAGLFEVADQGTLFLDEIGEMSLSMQAKLLRVLEEGEVHPLGAERGRRVDVRVITATHRDLEEMTKDGRFRSDLFYRLNVIAIRVPALRERVDDIPLLVQHFLTKHGQGKSIRVAAEAMARLKRFRWPGNVRQLENEVRRAIVLSDGIITVEHLSREVQKPDDGDKGPRTLRVRDRVDALEAELVGAALHETRGNQTRAAAILGLSRFGLQKMMKRLGIRAPS